MAATNGKCDVLGVSNVYRTISHAALVKMAPTSDHCVDTMLLSAVSTKENTGLIRVTATDTSKLFPCLT